MWRFAAFELADEILHFVQAQDLTGLDGSPFTDARDNFVFDGGLTWLTFGGQVCKNVGDDISR